MVAASSAQAGAAPSCSSYVVSQRDGGGGMGKDLLAMSVEAVRAVAQGVSLDCTGTKDDIACHILGMCGTGKGKKDHGWGPRQAGGRRR